MTVKVCGLNIIVAFLRRPVGVSVVIMRQVGHGAGGRKLYKFVTCYRFPGMTEAK